MAGLLKRVAAAPHRHWSSDASRYRSSPPPTSPAKDPDGRPELPAGCSHRAAQSAPHTPEAAAILQPRPHIGRRAGSGDHTHLRRTFRQREDIQPVLAIQRLHAPAVGDDVQRRIGGGIKLRRRLAQRGGALARRCHTGRTLPSSQTNGAQDAASRVGFALAQPEPLPRLRARRDPHPRDAIGRRSRRPSRQDPLHESRSATPCGHRRRRAEQFVRFDVHVQVQVAGRAAAHASVPLPARRSRAPSATPAGTGTAIASVRGATPRP